MLTASTRRSACWFSPRAAAAVCSTRLLLPGFDE
jgi:hypothetical protein